MKNGHLGKSTEIFFLGLTLFNKYSIYVTFAPPNRVAFEPAALLFVY